MKISKLYLMYTVCTVMACQSCEIGCVEWRVFEKPVTYVANCLIIMYNYFWYICTCIYPRVYMAVISQTVIGCCPVDIPYVIVVTQGRLKSA